MMLVAFTPLPSAAVAVIVTLPFLRPMVTSPLASTLAIEVSLLAHVTFLFVALSGLTATESCTFFSPLMVTFGRFIVRDVTLTAAARGVILPLTLYCLMTTVSRATPLVVLRISSASRESCVLFGLTTILTVPL